ncbi:hypothetical protein CSV72_15270 [Sporosarcina sp. P20a]|uniref:hypothetical protein n=1 Tax=Sporosarcina sp. P20a TaxID=2048256 RepID=UPI000C16312E|nr:hypothetical protein [Sporosarcina sp. P20a]PIC85147.1 hypothetical protein CSV72_15270 [Sporosarcina sp. P20a]
MINLILPQVIGIVDLMFFFCSKAANLQKENIAVINGIYLTVERVKIQEVYSFGTPKPFTIIK